MYTCVCKWGYYYTHKYIPTYIYIWKVHKYTYIMYIMYNKITNIKCPSNLHGFLSLTAHSQSQRHFIKRSIGFYWRLRSSSNSFPFFSLKVFSLFVLYMAPPALLFLLVREFICFYLIELIGLSGWLWFGLPPPLKFSNSVPHSDWKGKALPPSVAQGLSPDTGPCSMS